MIDYNDSKAKAIKLRKSGLSYGEIKKKINVSKSTLSFWLKGIELSKEQKEKLYTNNIAILNRGPNSQKERRQREISKIISDAEKEIKPLSSQTYKLIGAFIYWGEGNKIKNFCVTNSDPYLILFMVKWFEKIFKVAPNELSAWLNIYPQQNELEIKKFWSDLTGIPLKNFGKSFIKPMSKNYKTNNLYYGTIKVHVPKGTNYRHKVYAWIKTVLKEIAPSVSSTQKKWQKLTEVSRAVNI
jgi:hypothetical protein